ETWGAHDASRGSPGILLTAGSTSPGQSVSSAPKPSSVLNGPSSLIVEGDIHSTATEPTAPVVRGARITPLHCPGNRCRGSIRSRTSKRSSPPTRSTRIFKSVLGEETVEDLGNKRDNPC